MHEFNILVYLASRGGHPHVLPAYGYGLSMQEMYAGIIMPRMEGEFKR